MKREELLTKLAMELADWDGSEGLPGLPRTFKWDPRDLGAIFDWETDEKFYRDDWLAERERLINKPNWEDAPEWAQWLAQDGDGEWWWFELEPEPAFARWSQQCKVGLASKGEVPDGHRFQGTLERRPAECEWPSEARIDIVAQNGPTGCHYPQSSGGDNDYWVAKITDPKRLQPYQAECEDIIEYFQMTFQEGEAFKALWRNGMLRLGMGKPGDTSLRNAEKVSHFGDRMIAMEKRKETTRAET